MHGHVLQALALIELHRAFKGLYKNEVYLLPKKMGKEVKYPRVQLHAVDMILYRNPGLTMMDLSAFLDESGTLTYTPGQVYYS